MIFLASLRAAIRAASWFAALGEPPTEGDLAEARAHVDAHDIVGVTSWPEAEDFLQSPAASLDWWDREEALRKKLLAEAQARYPERALWTSLTELTTEAGDLVHGKTATAAARAGNARGPASVHVAAGAASQAVYQLAVARLAGDEVSPFESKFRLFAAGRWPLGMAGSSLGWSSSRGNDMQRTVGKLERPFGQLHYEVTGSGPALLFAHGLGGNHLSWWQQVAHFAAHYTCVAFAHRGFAPSDPVPGGPDAADYAGDLAALIDHLEFPDVRLVGQSMGGWTVMDYAIAHPAKVKALVLSSTSGTLDRRGADPSVGKDYDAWLAKAEAAIRAGTAKGIHPAMGARGAARLPALHLLYRGIDEMAGALDKEKLRSSLRRTATRRLGDLEDFRVPTLLIAGGEDVVFPPFLASAIAAKLPCADARLIPTAGHSPYFEEAATFNRLVEDFLALHR